MMTDHPRVSVVITSYNQKYYLIKAIESVIDQTVRPHEIIVADDYSTDGSISAIQDYANCYPGWIKGVFQERNVGIPRNRNAGLHQVTGDYVAILDGDDRYLPRNLERQLQALVRHPGAGCAYSNLYCIDAQGTRTHIRDDTLQPSGDVFAQIAAGQMGLLRSMLIRYNLVQSVGLLDERFPKHDGFVLTLRLAKQSEFVYVPEPLAEHRVYEGSDSGSFSNAQRRRYLEDVYAEVLKLSQDLPPQEIRQIKAAWSWRFVRLQIATEIEKGNRMGALLRLGGAIAHNPRQAAQRLLQRITSRYNRSVLREQHFQVGGEPD